LRCAWTSLPMQPLVVPPCGRKPSAFYDRLAAAAPWDGVCPWRPVSFLFFLHNYYSV